MNSDQAQPAPVVAPGEPEAPVAPTGPPAAPGTATKSEMFEEGPEADAIVALEVEDPAEAADLEAVAEAEAEMHAAASAGDHAPKLTLDLEQLAARAQKADQYLELAQRTKADFENFRKRAAREAAAAQDRGVAKLARELLPAVDNLDRALEAAQADGVGESDTLVSGIKLVHADVIAALARVGIERYSPQGESFDPQCHEAVAQLPVQGAAPGTIVEVYQRGYRIGDNVLRPARVVVAG
ncbi:MAG: nucleotide exchange factor GrpE [Solirubrobacteraceae bacterium]|jgi:molecular chaperone GrpE